jgi:acid phosphatase (class A)
MSAKHVFGQLKRPGLALAVVVLTAGMTAALAQDAKPRAPGYLGAAVPDSSRFIPPPPAEGSPAEAVDKAAYEATRKLEGGPRWALATRDAVQTPAAMLADFDCAVGATLDESTTPKLLHVFARMAQDAGAIIDQAKNKYRRPRPFTRWPGNICSGKPEDMAKSWSYPSGHTTAGWSAALIVAELAPDRATEILARGRAYGESRVVCGVHYVSDVEAGRTNAAGLVAALHADPAFRADLDAARAELDAVRKGSVAPPAGAQCEIQADAAAHPPW